MIPKEGLQLEGSKRDKFSIKNKNIRNHSLILGGVINEALEKKTNIDLTFYDLKKCFDSLAPEFVMNDLAAVTENNDILALMYEENVKSTVAINTPCGMTENFELKEIEMQGSVLAPIKCSNQVDTLGKECQVKNENLYNYKGTTLPPLSYVDDLATIS